MEYTKDVIFNIHYKDEKINTVAYERHRKLKKIVKKIMTDEYLTIVIFVSIVVLVVDYLLVKQFIEIVNLL